MRCPQCQSDLVLWCHRSAVERHRWESGEGTCTCGPRALCAVCEIDLLRENALVLLDVEAWPSAAPYLN